MQKLVLFDIDSTLLRAPEANALASSVMFKKVYRVDAHEEMIDNHGKTEKEIIFEVLQKVHPHQKFTVSKKAHQVYAEAAKEALQRKPAIVIDGVIDLLSGLQDHNIPYGLLTGNSYERAEVKLISARLDSYFRDEKGELAGAFGDMTLKREDLIEIAKKRMGYPNAMVILIDDSRSVARMVARLGIPAIMVATGKTPVDELKKYVPNVVPTFANGGWKEVIRIIEEY